MFTFARLLTIAALAVAASSSALPAELSAVASKTHCAGASLVSTQTADVDGKVVTLNTLSCAATANKIAVAAETTTKDVCGSSFTTACNELAGILPPISQDCQTISNSITIFAGISSPTFTVAPSHQLTLSFGTCLWAFTSLSSQTLEYCWSDYNSTALASGAACFPPVQPFFSEGLSTASDGVWSVAASHS